MTFSQNFVCILWICISPKEKCSDVGLCASAFLLICNCSINVHCGACSWALYQYWPLIWSERSWGVLVCRSCDMKIASACCSQTFECCSILFIINQITICVIRELINLTHRHELYVMIWYNCIVHNIEFGKSVVYGLWFRGWKLLPEYFKSIANRW